VRRTVYLIRCGYFLSSALLYTKPFRPPTDPEKFLCWVLLIPGTANMDNGCSKALSHVPDQPLYGRFGAFQMFTEQLHGRWCSAML